MLNLLRNSLDQVAQSIVSLTKSLGEDMLSLIVLRKLIGVISLQNIVRSFCTAKAPHIFWQIIATRGFASNTFENLTSREQTTSLVLNNWALIFGSTVASGSVY